MSIVDRDRCIFGKVIYDPAIICAVTIRGKSRRDQRGGGGCPRWHVKWVVFHGHRPDCFTSVPLAIGSGDGNLINVIRIGICGRFVVPGDHGDDASGTSCCICATQCPCHGALRIPGKNWRNGCVDGIFPEDDIRDGIDWWNVADPQFPVACAVAVAVWLPCVAVRVTLTGVPTSSQSKLSIYRLKFGVLPQP